MDMKNRMNRTKYREEKMHPESCLGGDWIILIIGKFAMNSKLYYNTRKQSPKKKRGNQREKGNYPLALYNKGRIIISAAVMAKQWSKQNGFAADTTRLPVTLPEFWL